MNLLTEYGAVIINSRVIIVFCFFVMVAKKAKISSVFWLILLGIDMQCLGRAKARCIAFFIIRIKSVAMTLVLVLSGKIDPYEDFSGNYWGR